MQNPFRHLIQGFQAAFAQPAPAVVCVLPMPAIKIRQPKAPTVEDMYEIDVQKNKDGKAVAGVFGFHTATAMRRNEGSVPHLTTFDIEMLKTSGGEKSLWGNERHKAGRITNSNNAAAKIAWHDGANSEQIAKAVKLSVSWAEKRHSAFEAALKQEIGAQ